MFANKNQTYKLLINIWTHWLDERLKTISFFYMQFRNSHTDTLFLLVLFIVFK